MKNLFYERIEKIFNDREDVDLIFKFNERSDFCKVILSYPNRTGFSRFDIPLNDTKEEANNE